MSRSASRRASRGCGTRGADATDIEERPTSCATRTQRAKPAQSGTNKNGVAARSIPAVLRAAAGADALSMRVGEAASLEAWHAVAHPELDAFVSLLPHFAGTPTQGEDVRVCDESGASEKWWPVRFSTGRYKRLRSSARGPRRSGGTEGGGCRASGAAGRSRRPHCTAAVGVSRSQHSIW